jgi:ABC-type antimicrobial peptide transport system permease subunit
MSGKKIQIKDINIIKNEFKIKSMVAVNRVFNKIIMSRNKFITGVSVFTTDKGLSDFFRNNYMLEGNWLTKETDCVLGSIVAKEYNILVGDEIRIGNNHYTISGIIRIPKFNISILIPQSSIQNLELNDCVYYINQTKEINEIENYINQNFNSYMIYNENSILKQEKKRMQSGWGPSIIISVIAFIYGIMNIKNMEKFYFAKKMINCGIMRALGASRLQIFFVLYIEKAILSIISALITYVLVYLLHLTSFNYVITMNVNINILILLLGFGQLFSIILLIDNFLYITKENIVNIINKTI